VIDFGKRNVLGVLVDAVDYEAAATRVLDAARAGRQFAGAALAVHGVMTGVADNAHRYRLNHLDLVTPDGQPVRWALNLLYRTGLRERVYGPTLTVRLLDAAAAEGLPVYFYGSTTEVLDRLTANVRTRWPSLVIAGAQPSRFRVATPAEKAETVERIRRSGARLVFVGLGCPRQEVFCFEHRELVDAPLLAVGAAFPYHAGTLSEPPDFIQRWGLQWVYRLMQEPRRLWRRYLLLNPKYVVLLVGQRVGLWKPDPAAVVPPVRDVGVA
jgi:exopolysaccharide biosynthesis WecB/TagA/CpsF family protein